MINDEIEQRLEALEEAVGMILEALDIATEPVDELRAGYERFMARGRKAPREE